MKLPHEMKLSEIASVVGGQTDGNVNITIQSLALDPFTAKTGELAVFFDHKLLRHILKCNAEAVIVPPGIKTNQAKIVHSRPLLAWAKLLQVFQVKRFLPSSGIHPSAIVDPTCQLGSNVSIGPYVVIGPQTKIGNNTTIMAHSVIGGLVVIGDNCLLHPACLIADYVQIGNRVVMQQGASLGSDGFGYVTEKPSNVEKRMSGNKDLSNEPNPLTKIPQIGIVIVEDDVEIGSYATIDRATIGATIIGAGSKIDNQVMIAHNTCIGKEVIIVAQSAVAGSCKIGDRTVIAGHAGIKDHVNIGQDSIVEGMAGVMRDVIAGSIVSGIPAVPAREHFTNLANVYKLPKIYDEIKALKKKLNELEKSIAECSSSENNMYAKHK